MKKKVKLSLEQLRVNSFVTSLKEGESLILKGGEGQTLTVRCLTQIRECEISVHIECPRTQNCVTFHEGCTSIRECGGGG